MLGTQGLTPDSIDNPEHVMTIKGMPPPRNGDIIYGRNEDSRAQFNGVVLWVTHDYETRIIKVWARK